MNDKVNYHNNYPYYTTYDEINFIKRMNPDRPPWVNIPGNEEKTRLQMLEEYLKILLRRVKWGKMDRERVLEFLEKEIVSERYPVFIVTGEKMEYYDF